jgi:hypothetical protein
MAKNAYVRTLCDEKATQLQYNYTFRLGMSDRCGQKVDTVHE